MAYSLPSPLVLGIFPSDYMNLLCFKFFILVEIFVGKFCNIPSRHLRMRETLNIFLWPWDNHFAFHLLFLTSEVSETIFPDIKNFRACNV